MERAVRAGARSDIDSGAIAGVDAMRVSSCSLYCILWIPPSLIQAESRPPGRVIARFISEP
jgi:hypothetical protein